ncbi:hypothetical protein [Alteromonas facilis]|uniref:hypothetical protein n=1 Tax=Alteromonas facilis TaxID=2048004 RepID=UPI000C283B43|nr:hypothetical protein [Alteromonas facilis]
MKVQEIKSEYVIHVLKTLVFILGVCFVANAYAQDTDTETRYIYTYHNKPPFIVDLNLKTGLYFDLAEYLSSKDPKRQYITEYVPRKSLDRLIESKRLDGIVVGVNPLWFNDPEESRFLWLPGIYHDRDEFVSLPSTPFEYNGQDAYNGKSVAAVDGFYYVGINEAVAERYLDRINTIGEKQVLELVAKKRADFGIVSASFYAYLQSIDAIKQDFHLSENPHDSFMRRAFVLQSEAALHSDLNSIMTSIASDEEWLNILQKYQK